MNDDIQKPTKDEAIDELLASNKLTKHQKLWLEENRDALELWNSVPLTFQDYRKI